jgi:hypothetical protein
MNLTAETDQTQTKKEPQPQGFDFGAIALYSPGATPPPPPRLGQTPLQAKLTIGQPNDQYEQEADQVAHQVVNRLRAASSQVTPIAVQRQGEVGSPGGVWKGNRLNSNSNRWLQREVESEEEELQMKPATDSLQRQSQEEEDLQMKPQSHPLQRQPQQEEEELQLKATGSAASAEGQVSATVESSIQTAKGSGQPLSNPIRQPLEQAFSADFSQVKIHTDSQSDQLNRSIQAKAFTTGQDIFFRQGAYDPGNSTGQELLAHELTHVVQQNGQKVRRKTANPVAQTSSLPPQPLTIGDNSTPTEEIQRKAYEGVDVADVDAITNYVTQKFADLGGRFTLKSTRKKKATEILSHTPRMHRDLVRVLYQNRFHEPIVEPGTFAADSVDISDTSTSNKANTLKTIGKTAIAVPVGVGAVALGLGLGAATLPVSLPYGIYKAVQKRKEKKLKKAAAAAAQKNGLVLNPELDPHFVASVAKSLYDANNQHSLLTYEHLAQILELGQRPEGKVWLEKAGFKTSGEVQRYGHGKDFKNWENESAGFKMQVATYQFDAELTNTPGYHKALSAKKMTAQIHQNDADTWMKTLATPNRLTDATQQALTQNNNTYTRDTYAGESGSVRKDGLKKGVTDRVTARQGQGYLGSEQALLNSNAAAISIVQRIFIVLQRGLSYADKNGGADLKKWEAPVAVALSHGGRVNIRVPKVEIGRDQHEFFNWLTGGQGNMEMAKMHVRPAGTHRVDVQKDKAKKRGAFKEKGGFGAAIQAGMGWETGDTHHFGLDLPVGGLGQLDMNGNVILPNGSYGHLYIGYKPPTTSRDGALQIGCETDAPGMTNALGHMHTAKATSAEHSSTGGLKADKIGASKGGMVVDLSAIAKDENNWMAQLQHMEQEVQQGKVTSQQLVGQRQLQFLPGTNQAVDQNLQNPKVRKLMKTGGQGRQELEQQRQEEMQQAQSAQLMEDLEEAGLV